jgi:hypothetical protein
LARAQFEEFDKLYGEYPSSKATDTDANPLDSMRVQVHFQKECNDVHMDMMENEESC